MKREAGDIALYVKFIMNKDARQHLVLVVLIFLVAAAGMASVFASCRMLAWIVIVMSDSYLSVLLLAAIRSDDEAFLDKHSWITFFFSLKTTGLLVVTLVFVAVVSGFAGLYVGTDVFRPSKTPLDALYISFFIMGFTDYSPTPGYGQLVVIAQLASGVLLLVALFPLLISRISTFKNP